MGGGGVLYNILIMWLPSKILTGIWEGVGCGRGCKI